MYLVTGMFGWIESEREKERVITILATQEYLYVYGFYSFGLMFSLLSFTLTTHGHDYSEPQSRRVRLTNWWFNFLHSVEINH